LLSSEASLFPASTAVLVGQCAISLFSSFFSFLWSHWPPFLSFAMDTPRSRATVNVTVLLCRLASSAALSRAFLPFFSPGPDCGVSPAFWWQAFLPGTRHECPGSFRMQGEGAWRSLFSLRLGCSEKVFLPLGSYKCDCRAVHRLLFSLGRKIGVPICLLVPPVAVRSRFP